MSAAEKLTKAEKLALVGAVAPTLRENADRAKARRVALVDKDGNVTGYTTLLEAQKSLLKRHALEIEVQPGEKPKAVPCKRCGLPAPVPKVGRPPQFCVNCKSARCARCHAPLKKGATLPWKNARRKSAPKCAACVAAEVKERAVQCVDCGCPVGRKVACEVRQGRKRPESARCRPCFEKLPLPGNLRARRGADFGSFSDQSEQKT